MKRLFLLISLTSSFAAYANPSPPLYQVDLIVFAHNDTGAISEELTAPIFLEPQQAISLQAYDGNSAPYHLLPSSSSGLRNELWALNHKGNYQVLGHYSWLQPAQNQKPIILPRIDRSGWNVEGTLRIRHSHYFLVDSELLFSAPHTRSTSFVLSQKHKLQENKVYYLDHPHAGMLLKIHKVA
ncbi:CsiV family protein [Legionella yabuuchiae]|uniref:CsiV family protein n=1 Tax=Legionella yabuuchiae TaxID=376727 RepID=UPI0010546BF6|nr:CsiV family protein [Legionella yabuuchiae]